MISLLRILIFMCYDPKLVTAGIYPTERYVARIPACSTAWQASSARRTNERARHARQRAERAGLDMLDSEQSEQEEISFSI